MELEIGHVITLEDNKDYIILKKVNYNNAIYIYLMTASKPVDVAIVKEEIIKVMQDEPIYASPEESIALMEQAVRSGQMTIEEFQERMMSGTPMQIGVKQVEVEVPKIVKNQPNIFG